MSFPETDAVRLAQQGDGAAFEYLYRLYSRRVYTICLQMLRDKTEAEDLTRDVFLQSFRHIQDLRGESAFSNALLRLTLTLVRKRRALQSKPSTLHLPELNLSR